MNQLNKILLKIFNGKYLNVRESEILFTVIFDGKLSNEQISSILAILSFRGESFEEILGAVNILKKRSKKIQLTGELIDTCGTGGDNKKSFNISTATAILASACGLNVAKHGNRSVTSKSGSIDILEALGIEISDSISNIKKMYNKAGICFLFAPNFHKTLGSVAQIRKNINIRTIFNLLGPLLNPSNVSFQLLGVTEKKFLETHSKCLSRMNLKESWVIHNLDGYDELTTTSTNLIIKIKGKKTSKPLRLSPGDVGFKICKQNDLVGGDSKENAFIMNRLFEGETGPIRDNVILNTSACLLISGKVKNFKEGIDLASNTIDNYKAKRKLEELISINTRK